jgi:hypothetical protein
MNSLNVNVNVITHTLELMYDHTAKSSKPKNTYLSKEEVVDILESIVPTEMMAENSDDMDTQEYLEHLAIIT